MSTCNVQENMFFLCLEDEKFLRRGKCAVAKPKEL